MCKYSKFWIVSQWIVEYLILGRFSCLSFHETYQIVRRLRLFADSYSSLTQTICRLWWFSYSNNSYSYHLLTRITGRFWYYCESRNRNPIQEQFRYLRTIQYSSTFWYSKMNNILFESQFDLKRRFTIALCTPQHKIQFYTHAVDCKICHDKATVLTDKTCWLRKNNVSVVKRAE